MTQQPQAEDRGDEVTEDVATHATPKYRQDMPGGADVDPQRAIGVGQVRTRWSLRHPRDATPMEMRADLTRLASAFPGFSFAICQGWDGPRFEARRDAALSGLYAIITDNPRELWRELEMAVR
jgi:hypothetical protein